jgi:hypothetical protein
MDDPVLWAAEKAVNRLATTLILFGIVAYAAGVFMPAPTHVAAAVVAQINNETSIVIKHHSLLITFAVYMENTWNVLVPILNVYSLYATLVLLGSVTPHIPTTVLASELIQVDIFLVLSSIETSYVIHAIILTTMKQKQHTKTMLKNATKTAATTLTIILLLSIIQTI